MRVSPWLAAPGMEHEHLERGCGFGDRPTNGGSRIAACRCAAVDRPVCKCTVYITSDNCSCSDYRLVSDPNEYRILMYAAVGSRACYCRVNKIQETYIPLDQRYPQTHKRTLKEPPNPLCGATVIPISLLALLFSVSSSPFVCFYTVGEVQ